MLEPYDSNPSFRRLTIDLADNEDPEGEIKRITKRATQLGIAVKWYSEFLPNSITIYDPKSPKGYIYGQVLAPKVGREDRPPFVIAKEHQEDSFNKYLREYERIWGEARVPNLEEYDA